jgi:hypothetical protein
MELQMNWRSVFFAQSTRMLDLSLQVYQPVALGVTCDIPSGVILAEECAHTPDSFITVRHVAQAEASRDPSEATRVPTFPAFAR